jgi:hypothetical protein
VHTITNEDILVLRHCEEHSIKLDGSYCEIRAA